MSRDLVVLRGGELLASGLATEWFATLAERAVQGYRLNGVRNSLFEQWAFEVAEAAARGRAAVVGSAALPMGDVPPSLGLVDPVTAAEAAAVSGCRVRNITGLCVRGVFDTARKVGGVWQIERAEVLARVERKAG